MATKAFPAIPVKKKTSARIARPASCNSPLRAHPCLIHGFLVPMPARSPISPDGASPMPLTVAPVDARAPGPSDSKHEGPGEDATFH